MEAWRFQIRDDILDVISDPETLGKPVGSDDKNEKIHLCVPIRNGESAAAGKQADPASGKRPVRLF